jgi:hypothetical protein
MKNIKRIFAAVIMLIMLFTIVPLSPANNTAFAEETAPAGEKDAYDLSDGFKEKVYCKATLERWLCRRCCAYCYQQIRERD